MVIDGNRPKPPVVSRKDAPPWLVIAQAEMGVHELPGSGTHPRIAEYYKATNIGGMPEDGATPWCSAFMCWVMEKASYKSPRRANARSWLDWGQSLEEPKPGCVAVLWRGVPDAATGHVCLWIGPYQHDKFFALGGNQGNQVSHQLYGTGRVLSYRWPKESDWKGL
jgi:uncharacterized protein (TIGR02594 family)